MHFVVFATIVYFYLYYVEFGHFPAFFYTVFFDAALYVSDAAGHHICTHLAHCWHGYNGYLDATFHIVVLVPSGLTLYAKVIGSLRQASLHYSDSALFIAALVPAGMFILAIFAAIFVELGRYPAFFHAFYLDVTLFIAVLAGMLLYAKLSGKFWQACERCSDSYFSVVVLVLIGMRLLAVFAAIYLEFGYFPFFFFAIYFDATLYVMVVMPLGMLLYAKFA